MSTSTESKTATRTVVCDPKIGVSVCIPSVFRNISWRRIKEVMISCNWGFIERVDVVPNGRFKKAFVHFAPGKWNMRNSQARAVLTALQQGKTVEIAYDEYEDKKTGEMKDAVWFIRASRSKKPAEAPKRKVGPKVVIQGVTQPKKKIDLTVDTAVAKVESDYDLTAQPDEEFRDYLETGYSQLGGEC